MWFELERVLLINICWLIWVGRFRVWVNVGVKIVEDSDDSRRSRVWIIFIFEMVRLVYLGLVIDVLMVYFSD